MRNLLLKLSGLTGLITVPGSIALLLWLMSWPFLALDRFVAQLDGAWLTGVIAVDREIAIAVLSTIAGSAMTALSLVYSLVLVVFTLAAGNIGPRLLQRFTKDRVNQVTAGILGGLFLYGITVLHSIGPEQAPSISVAVAVLLSAIAILQLIFFVHTVSRRVTIDEEVASISHQLEARLEAITAEEAGNPETGGHVFRKASAVEAREPGYLGAIDTATLAARARKESSVIEIIQPPGHFLLAGRPFARFEADGLSEEACSRMREAINTSVLIARARGSEDDTEYAVNLLVEISMRALSPGVNDTFTAIACVDRLSAAFAGVVARGLSARRIRDERGAVRVEMEGYGVETLLVSAFAPLRRASRSNAMMVGAIADALLRLRLMARDEVVTLLDRELDLLLEEFEQSNPLEPDRKRIEEQMRTGRQESGHA